LNVDVEIRLIGTSDRGESRKSQTRGRLAGPGRGIPEGEPAPSTNDEDWAEWGGELLLAVGGTAGGAPFGMSLEDFRRSNEHWLERHRLSMLQVHRAGDKAFVDYAGQRPRLVDSRLPSPSRIAQCPTVRPRVGPDVLVHRPLRQP
jgi:hypothetical protein